MWWLTMEYKFIASAIKVKDANTGYYIIITGKRHYNCYEWAYKHKLNSTEVDEGFIIRNNGTDSFYNRSDAAEIARSIGINSEYKNCLYSEDIWAD